MRVIHHTHTSSRAKRWRHQKAHETEVQMQGKLTVVRLSSTESSFSQFRLQGSLVLHFLLVEHEVDISKSPRNCVLPGCQVSREKVKMWTAGFWEIDGRQNQAPSLRGIDKYHQNRFPACQSETFARITKDNDKRQERREQTASGWPKFFKKTSLSESIRACVLCICLAVYWTCGLPGDILELRCFVNSTRQARLGRIDLRWASTALWAPINFSSLGPWRNEPRIRKGRHDIDAPCDGRAAGRKKNSPLSVTAGISVNVDSETSLQNCSTHHKKRSMQSQNRGKKEKRKEREWMKK